MWKKIKDTEYFLLFTQNYDYEICITDYISIWSTFYSEKAFIAQLKESNEGLELENDNEFTQKGLLLLSNLDQLKKISITKEENGKSLFLSMRMIFGFPFYFECKLSKGSEEFFFQKVTRPLLKVVGDLRASQSELRRLLIKKDKEIEEYKCEGGEIVLRHLKTVAFNDEEHMKKFKTYEENFGSTDIPASLVEKVVELPHKIVKEEPAVIKEEIKQESIRIKEEPHTPVFEDHVPPVPSLPSNCKQEVFKTEGTSSQTNINDRRKRLKKLNY